MPRFLRLLILLAVIAAAALYAAFRLTAPGQILDGPGMEREYPHDMIGGEWAELGSDDPARLSIRDGTVFWKDFCGESGSCGFTMQESSSNDDIDRWTLELDGYAPFETLELTMEGDDIILSATMMEYDGRGLIVIAEFAYASEADSFPDDYISVLAHRLNDREPEPTCIVQALYGDAELSECLSWLGLPAAETAVDPGGITETPGGMRAEVTGLLFGAEAYGTIGFGSEEDGYPLRELDFRTYDLTFEELRGALAERYGEPADEGEEPYAEVNGGAVLWCEFEDGSVSVRISTPSEWEYTELEARLAAE